MTAETTVLAAPAIGVGCGIVLLREGKVLLVRRRRAPEAGRWSLVGGKIDVLESGEAAARRECLEEVGIEAEALALLGVSEQPLAAEGQHWISLIFLAGRFSGEASLLEPEKHAELGWFDPDAPPSPLALGARDGLAFLQRHRDLTPGE